MIGRLLATIRGRLGVVLLISAVPLVTMAASIAWQNYGVVIAEPRQDLMIIRRALQIRDATLIEDAGRLVARISDAGTVLEGNPTACNEYFAEVLRLSGGRFVQIAALDQGGKLQAQAPASAGGQDVESGPLLWLTAPITAGRWAGGSIHAKLSLEWLVEAQQTLLADSHGRVWPVDSKGALEAPNERDEDAAPRGESLQSLFAHLATSPVVLWTAQDGARYNYALAPLAQGYRLLIALPSSAHLAASRDALLWRFVELGIMLFLALVGMAWGAEHSVARPIRRLSIAIQRWRDGGAFEARLPHDAPSEIVAMARTFGNATQALLIREHKLRDVSRQQDLLMQEIHHRVKNNLQIVASLLNLQANRIRQPEARSEFQAARDRIRALATLHRHLYAHGELHTINMRSFLLELCEQLLATIGETPAGGRIRLDITAPELTISSDMAVPIALIVTEAVSNAAKYAFPGGRSGHIAVRLEVTGASGADATVRLMIDDDGVGIPMSRGETDTGPRDGLGLSLIRGFARQLGATLHIKQDGGTHYVVDIPLHRITHDVSPRPAVAL